MSTTEQQAIEEARKKFREIYTNVKLGGKGKYRKDITTNY